MSALLDKRRHPYRDDLAAEALRGRVDAPRYAEGEAHRIKAPLAAIRGAPEQGAMLLTQGLLGERFNVFDRQGEWVWGQLESDNYVGYMPARHLTPRAQEPTHYVAAARSHIYPEANIKTTPDTGLSMMMQVSVAEQDGMFARLSGGGYMIARHLRRIGEYETNFAEVAARFLNTPYLWGGRSAGGIDCSALVQLSLAACGLSAPRDSDMQEAEVFTKLPGGLRNNAPGRGDLIFWPGHVGIMWSENELLHANGHHMMTVIEPLDEAVRRIEKETGPPNCLKRGPN